MQKDWMQEVKSCKSVYLQHNLNKFKVKFSNYRTYAPQGHLVHKRYAILLKDFVCN